MMKNGIKYGKNLIFSERNPWYKKRTQLFSTENMLSIFLVIWKKLRIPRLELKIASMKEDSLWRVIAHHICLTAFYSTSAPGDLLAGGTIYYPDSISLPFLTFMLLCLEKVALPFQKFKTHTYFRRWYVVS